MAAVRSTELIGIRLAAVCTVQVVGVAREAKLGHKELMSFELSLVRVGAIEDRGIKLAENPLQYSVGDVGEHRPQVRFDTFAALDRRVDEEK